MSGVRHAFLVARLRIGGEQWARRLSIVTGKAAREKRLQNPVSCGVLLEAEGMRKLRQIVANKYRTTVSEIIRGWVAEFLASMRRRTREQAATDKDELQHEVTRVEGEGRATRGCKAEAEATPGMPAKSLKLFAHKVGLARENVKATEAVGRRGRR